MEFALSQAVASGDTFEHRPSECGHCVQDFLADLDLRDLPGEAAGFELGADDTLPTADLRFYPAALVVRLLNHATVAADLGNMAIPHTEGLFHGLMLQGADGLPQKLLKI